MTIHETIGSDGIAELVMDNPKVNALNIGDAYALTAMLDAYKHNPDVRVVILTATGKGFCAGVDIKEMQALPGNEGILGANDSCWELFRAVYECAVPVIAAVNDFCLGTGIGIVGNADIVIAAETAVFGLPEVDNGALGAGTHLMRLVPQHRARQMMYMCEYAAAAELHAHGSVYKVVPLDALMSTARDVAAVIASKSPKVIRKAKRAFNTIDDDPTRSYRAEQGFTFELNLIGEGDKARDAFIRGER
ncbi:MAG TPA: enoyl-CoA hydratase family protein [Acidimicrobiales bacterium]|jgi:enoyl-CoA hydratase|nr:enoyl-CoA hydratase family protein [Acidimicrobiales bacterium]